mmetsp:Transcript_3171/g.9586  ORF Transcript_3171/g.9586 Transcript_3171/m.9586 type:complete len:345 (+) Transcript_3171:1352-2386(+)
MRWRAAGHHLHQPPYILLLLQLRGDGAWRRVRDAHDAGHRVRDGVEVEAPFLLRPALLRRNIRHAVHEELQQLGVHEPLVPLLLLVQRVLLVAADQPQDQVRDGVGVQVPHQLGQDLGVGLDILADLRRPPLHRTDHDPRVIARQDAVEGGRLVEEGEEVPEKVVAALGLVVARTPHQRSEDLVHLAAEDLANPLGGLHRVALELLRSHGLDLRGLLGVGRRGPLGLGLRRAGPGLLAPLSKGELVQLLAQAASVPLTLAVGPAVVALSVFRGLLLLLQFSQLLQAELPLQLHHGLGGLHYVHHKLRHGFGLLQVVYQPVVHRLHLLDAILLQKQVLQREVISV